MEIDIESFIEKVIEATLDYENCTAGYEISVSLVNNKEIKNLNKEYRKIDEPTDVLSFPLIDFNDLSGGFLSISNSYRCDCEKLSDIELPLGDIVISMEKAKEQAQAYGHDIKRELAFLLIHGTLHLLGYDHENRGDETIMFGKQKEILKQLNLDG